MALEVVVGVEVHECDVEGSARSGRPSRCAPRAKPAERVVDGGWMG